MDTKEPKKDEKENTNTKENDEAEEKKGENLSEEEKKKFLDELNKLKLDSMRRKKGEIKDKYKFWEEQPVPQFSKDIGVEFGPINKDCKVENERKEPYPLPAGFEWKDVDVTNPSELTRLYEFLKNNYVEYDEKKKRKNSCEDFLRCHPPSPGYY